MTRPAPAPPSQATAGAGADGASADSTPGGGGHPGHPACDHCGAADRLMGGVWKNNWPTYWLCPPCQALPITAALLARIQERLIRAGRWGQDPDEPFADPFGD